MGNKHTEKCVFHECTLSEFSHTGFIHVASTQSKKQNILGTLTECFKLSNVPSPTVALRSFSLLWFERIVNPWSWKAIGNGSGQRWVLSACGFNRVPTMGCVILIAQAGSKAGMEEEGDTLVKALYACMCVQLVMSDSLWPPGLYPARLLCPWDSPGKNTGVGCHSLLQGIFPIQGSNSCHLHWLADSSPLNHLGSPFSYEAPSELRFIKVVKALWFRSWGPRFWNQRYHLSLLEERPSPSCLICLKLREGPDQKTKMCLSHWGFCFSHFGCTPRPGES